MSKELSTYEKIEVEYLNRLQDFFINIDIFESIWKI